MSEIVLWKKLFNRENDRRENAHTRRMFGRSASMRLPAIMTGSGYTTNHTGSSVSATPFGSADRQAHFSYLPPAKLRMTVETSQSVEFRSREIRRIIWGM
ncbi:hypothetical protein M378DRAFT_1017272 [Amanita muscaria Koide BX008]|uniref:Uncharacterized protein n=1 Tax=Amanita muscaria (strain Koide BX008) TaxID=946122 RepID=A0A0C2WR34_AMAMK|nr:hypothetical protein M378DRAFT_1017272 [Amanita muscaria Koide BX008]